MHNVIGIGEIGEGVSDLTDKMACETILGNHIENFVLPHASSDVTVLASQTRTINASNPGWGDAPADAGLRSHCQAGVHDPPARCSERAYLPQKSWRGQPDVPMSEPYPLLILFPSLRSHPAEKCTQKLSALCSAPGSPICGFQLVLQMEVFRFSGYTLVITRQANY